MRKVFLIIAVAALLPIAAFADLGVGAAAFYKSPVLIGQSVDKEEVNVDQFSFGGDLRFKLGWFQAEGLLLYSAGEFNSLDAFFDAGVSLDIAMVALSIGAGPNFTNNLEDGPTMRAGLNAKIGADMRFGPISAGLSYIMALNIDDGIDVRTSSGLLGFQVLFWL